MTDYKPASQPAVFLGIDPGTKCGWALVSESGALVQSGVWVLANRTGEGAGMRFLRLRAYLRDVVMQQRPIGLAYELVRSHGPKAGTQTAHVYGGIVATVTQVCEDLGCPYQGLEVKTIKAHATGKGNAGKPAMVAAARKRWPFATPLVDDNEADARWIADLLRTQLDPKF